jgi:hypothetical protein
VVKLAGVLSGALYRRVSGKGDSINIGAELTKDDPLQISNLVLIYQNGFFCDVIVKKIGARLAAG